MKKSKSLSQGEKTADSIRKYSSQVLDGPDRAPSHAMLYPVGFRKEDFAKLLFKSRSKPALTVTAACNNDAPRWRRSVQ